MTKFTPIPLSERKWTRRKLNWIQYMQILCHPVQRDHKTRANTRNFHKKMKVRTPEHLETTTIRLGADIVNQFTTTGQVMKKGTEFLADSHGRRYWWDNYATDSNPRPKTLNDKVIEVYTWDELIEVYTWFNSPSDVKKANDRIFGAARAVLLPEGIFLTADPLLKVTPWEYASAGCYPEIFRYGKVSTETEACSMVQSFKPAVNWFQEEVWNDPEFSNNLSISAPITTAILMSYMKHRHDKEALSLLKEWIIKVSRKAINTENKTQNCASMFVLHWITNHSGDRISQYIGNGILSSGDQSKICQGFILLMIDGYIQGKEYERVPSPKYKEYYQDWQNDFKKKHTDFSGLEEVLYAK